jgi:hypothetical protein
MLWVVLLLPLFVFWSMERLKSKLMAVCALTAARQQQLPQQQQQQGRTGSEPLQCDRHAGSHFAALNTAVRESRVKAFHTTPEVLPFCLPWTQSCKVLVLSLLVCFVAGELFVLVCVLWPAVTGILRQPDLV